MASGKKFNFDFLKIV